MLFQSVRGYAMQHGVRLSGRLLPHGEHSLGWQDFIYLCCLSAAIQELDDSRGRAGKHITIASTHLQPYAKAKTRALGLEALASRIKYVDISNELINNRPGEDNPRTITLTYRATGAHMPLANHLTAVIRDRRCEEPWSVIHDVVRKVKAGTWMQLQNPGAPLPDQFRESIFDDALHAYNSSVVKFINLATDFAESRR